MKIFEVKVRKRRYIKRHCYFTNFPDVSFFLNKNDTMKTFSKEFLQKNYYLTGPCYDLEKIVRRKKEEINLCSPNMIV